MAGKHSLITAHVHAPCRALAWTMPSALLHGSRQAVCAAAACWPHAREGASACRGPSHSLSQPPQPVMAAASDPAVLMLPQVHAVQVAESASLNPEASSSNRPRPASPDPPSTEPKRIKQESLHQHIPAVSCKCCICSLLPGAHHSLPQQMVPQCQLACD